MAKGQARCVFIDANILLSFYDFTDDDLSQLEGLVAHAKDAHVEIVLPDNTIDEYFRNRDKKIADCIKTMKSAQVPAALPRLAQGYKEYDECISAAKELSKKRSELIDILVQDASSNNLKADRIIEDLIDTATTIKTTDELIDLARDRRDLRKSPGKGDSLGDQLAWEALLDRAPKGDLFVVSRDHDWASPLRPEVIRAELEAEWAADKSGQVKLFTSLRQFLKEVDLGIKLAEDQERRRLVDGLLDSGSFQTTHRLISELALINDFSNEEVNILIEALVSNNQVEWVASDSDVRNFFYELIERSESIIVPWNLERAKAIIKFDELARVRNLTAEELLDLL